MARKKMEDPANILKTVRLNQGMIDMINQYAKEKGLTFGKVIRQALEEFFKNK